LSCLASRRRRRAPGDSAWPAGSPTLRASERSHPPRKSQARRANHSIVNVHNLDRGHLPPAAIPAPPSSSPRRGHRQLVIGSEGTDIAKWLNELGIAAFVLKYRLAFTPNYNYTVEGEALADTQRAIRIVRSRASEFGVKPDRIGVLGFSAGGALAALANNRFDRGKSDATDPLDRESCRPDFVALVYPGWNRAMDTTPPKTRLPRSSPAAGKDDALTPSKRSNTTTLSSRPASPSNSTSTPTAATAKHQPRDGILRTWHIRMQD
jgi:hypothetical protein